MRLIEQRNLALHRLLPPPSRPGCTYNTIVPWDIAFTFNFWPFQQIHFNCFCFVDIYGLLLECYNALAGAHCVHVTCDRKFQFQVKALSLTLKTNKSLGKPFQSEGVWAMQIEDSGSRQLEKKYTVCTTKLNEELCMQSTRTVEKDRTCWEVGQ